jgi:hypothetical protein
MKTPPFVYKKTKNITLMIILVIIISLEERKRVHEQHVQFRVEFE